MPIEAKCPGCDRLLRVSDEYAGKQARCPVCNTIYSVPALPRGGSCPLPEASESSHVGDNLNAGELEAKNAEAGSFRHEETTEAGSFRHEAPLPVTEFIESEPIPDAFDWYMKTPEGQTFGPAKRPELNRWVSEGRVTADCELRADEGPWQTADLVFPVLRAPASTYTASPYEQPGSRAAESSTLSVPSYRAPHRGAIVLCFGLMGLITTCPILSIMAWVMGNGDLREMREGRMDPDGQGLTHAGYVMGMIMSGVWILVAVIGLFVMLFIAARK